MDGIAFVENVYEKITEVFLQNINRDNIEKAKEAYLSYLHKTYDKLFQDAHASGLDSVAALCVKKEKIIHLGLDEAAKIAFLFPDQNFLSLQALSFEIAGLARSKKLGEQQTLPKGRDEYISELKTISLLVSEPFKYSADRLLSEAFMDINYLFGAENEQSFRTAII